MSETKWKRPDTVPYPCVWRRFEGSKAFPNGVKPRFRIQDFTPDMMEDLIQNLGNNFIYDEPLSKALNLSEDKDGCEELFHMWKEWTKQRLVLVCLLENKDELDDDSLPIFVGCNMTGLKEIDSPHAQVKSEKLKKLFAILEYAESHIDCFKHYDVTEVMYALGLSVHRKYRGQAIGLEILRARWDMGRAVGLKATLTAFTAIPSQKLAHRAGFEVLYELPYTNYMVDGEIPFASLAPTTLKMMSARLD